jgi:hypothetical protein
MQNERRQIGWLFSIAGFAVFAACGEVGANDNGTAGGAPTSTGGGIPSGGHTSLGGATAAGGHSGGTSAGGATAGGATGGFDLGGGDGGTIEDGPILPAPLTRSLTDLSQFEVLTTCSVTPNVTLGSIKTVGIATFATTLPGAERAVIQFGKTAAYTLEAPVAWDAAQHRTLMLGMTPKTEWHYRVVVIGGSTACVSPDATLQTSALPAGSPGQRSVTAGTSGAPAEPGFRIVPAGNWAMIWNELGEPVWAYSFSSISSAVISWGGRFMYMRDTGVFNAPEGGNLLRVPMEGGAAEYLAILGGHHHDLVTIPTGFAYIAKLDFNECDHIMTANPDGSGAKSLADLTTYLAPFHSLDDEELCHVNAINYHAQGNYFTISDRAKDVVIRVDGETGALLGSIGKTPDGTVPAHIVAEGGGTTWHIQHGHHWYAPDKFVVFSNGPFLDGTSRVLHYSSADTTANLDWSYEDFDTSPTGSGVLRLPAGNFLAVASGGQILELDPDGELIQKWSNTDFLGYPRFYPVLYGPPMNY